MGQVGHSLSLIELTLEHSYLGLLTYVIKHEALAHGCHLLIGVQVCNSHPLVTQSLSNPCENYPNGSIKVPK